jgi:hypothetical protein
LKLATYDRTPTTRNNTDLERAQDRVADFARQFYDCPFLRGRHIKNVLVATYPAETRVEHGLGKTPEGWFLTRKKAIEHVIESPTTPATDKYIYLTSSYENTVDVWVF